jgi:SAM-dependent methyltransferase
LSLRDYDACEEDRTKGGMMRQEQIKQKVIEYYDQEAKNYSDLYTVAHMDQEFYPANAVRLEMILDILRGREVKTLLDVGCGSGHPLLRFLKLGFDARGFDFSPKMVEFAQALMKQEGHDPARVTQGDIEKRSTLPQSRFDAVIATGVFAHNLDEAAAFANLRELLADGGVALVEFRNALLALCSLNRYSAPFFWDELLQADQLPQELREATREFLSSKFDTEVRSVGKERSIEFTDILARFHNPLTLGDTAAAHGLKLTNIHYYHYHAAPPHLEKTHKRQFWEESLKLERSNDWRGMFLCSAYVAEFSK